MAEQDAGNGTLPDPPTPADSDLSKFPFYPVDIVRLYRSEFHALANDAEWRAGVTLWHKSFHQTPAGSLPDNDTALSRLAEFGSDLRKWRKVKSVALRNWLRHSDGRLYHRVVVEKVNKALARDDSNYDRTEKARAQKKLLAFLRSIIGNPRLYDGHAAALTPAGLGAVIEAGFDPAQASAALPKVVAETHRPGVVTASVTEAVAATATTAVTVSNRNGDRHREEGHEGRFINKAANPSSEMQSTAPPPPRKVIGLRPVGEFAREVIPTD